MKFNINDYKGKYVMRCKTMEEAVDFLRVLDNLGLMWQCGDSYLEPVWREHGSDSHLQPVWWEDDETCYDFNVGMEAEVSYYIKQGYTILNWADFADKN